MTQAASACTTRRALMGAAVSLPVVAGAVTVLSNETVEPHRVARDFIELLAFLHPKGREVALNAYRVDVDWSLLKGIELQGEFAPVLRFGQRPGSRGYPKAEIVASTAGVFLHGPVEAF